MKIRIGLALLVAILSAMAQTGVRTFKAHDQLTQWTSYGTPYYESSRIISNYVYETRCYRFFEPTEYGATQSLYVVRAKNMLMLDTLQMLWLHDGTVQSNLFVAEYGRTMEPWGIQSIFGYKVFTTQDGFKNRLTGDATMEAYWRTNADEAFTDNCGEGRSPTAAFAFLFRDRPIGEDPPLFCGASGRVEPGKTAMVNLPCPANTFWSYVGFLKQIGCDDFWPAQWPVKPASMAPNSIAGQSAGKVMLQFNGTPGSNYVVQSTSDLNRWRDHEVFTMLSENGVSVEIEPVNGAKFYRLLPVP